MPKSPEQFDFSKIDDQEKFEQLSWRERKKIINEAQEEGVEENDEIKLLKKDYVEAKAIGKDLQKKFTVDEKRLLEHGKKELMELKKEYPKFEDLSKNSFLTPEEHLWFASTPYFLESYPLTPRALMIFPDKLNEIKQKRKELKETSLFLGVNSDLILPNIKDAGYDFANLSLGEINNETGERGIPEITGLVRRTKKGSEVIRDSNILKNYKYNPKAFLEERLRRYDEYINEADEQGSQEKVNQLKECKESFQRYYKIK